MLQTQPGSAVVDLLARDRSSSPESLRFRFQEENRPLRHGLFGYTLLLHPDFSDGDCQLTHAADNADTLRHANRASRIQHVEKMRAFQRPIIRGKYGKSAFVFATSESPQQFVA